MKKIRTVTGFISYLSGDEEPLNEFKYSYKEYDSEQNLIKEVTYTGEGEIETASAYKFDGSNVLIEEIHYLNETEVAERIEYKYDENGAHRLIEKTYSDGSKNIQNFSQNGKIVKILITNEDNEFEGEIIRELDARGNAVKETVYNYQRKIEQRFICEYDAGNFLTRLVEFGDNDEFIIEKLYHYNEKGLMTKETHLSERGKLVDMWQWEYDENGNTLLQRSNDIIKRYYYDDNKRLIRDESIHIPAESVISSNNYKYDDKGLLIEVESYEMGEQYQVQPAIMARSASIHTRIRYEYELFA